MNVTTPKSHLGLPKFQGHKIQFVCAWLFVYHVMFLFIVHFFCGTWGLIAAPLFSIDGIFMTGSKVAFQVCYHQWFLHF